MPRRTKRRTNRKLKRGGLFSNLGPYASKKPKMDQRGRHKIAKSNRTKVESSEGVRGCGFTSWNKPRKKKSCVSDKWRQRGCYWLDPADACYDVNEKIYWGQLEAKGLPKSVVKKAKKLTKITKEDINLLSEDLLIYIPVKKTISPINVLIPKSSCEIFPISYPTKKPLNKLNMNALITIITGIFFPLVFNLIGIKIVLLK